MGFFKYQKYKLIFVIIMVLVSYKYCERVQKSLRKNTAFTTAKIIDFHKKPSAKNTTIYSKYQY